MASDHERSQLILVRQETSPEDLRGMKVGRRHSDGLRRRSARTRPWSAGRWARSASSAAASLTSTTTAGTVTVEGKVLKEGDDICIDGFTGEVFAGPSTPGRARSCRC